MTACFHLPSVTCENCAHLQSPRVEILTTRLIVAPDSVATKDSTYSPPLDGPVLYTRPQVEAMLRTALTDHTPEWTSKTVDERVGILLAMFDLPTKEKP